MKKARKGCWIAWCCAILLLMGCADKIPREALQLSPESLKNKQLQTRIFDTADEEKLLSASAAVLQDLGFNIDESETRLGVIVASKTRSAKEAGQIIGSICFALLTGSALPVDKEQKIRVSLVTRPIGATRSACAVRVTFQRIVWNTRNEVTKCETITDEEIYRTFFDKLSESVFLEGHKI